MKLLETKVRYQSGIATIDLYGEFTASATEVLDQAYTEAESYNPEAVLLNFGGIHYINSTGIALLIGLLIRARQTRCSLMVEGLSPIAEKIFELSRLAAFIQVPPNYIRV